MLSEVLEAWRDSDELAAPPAAPAPVMPPVDMASRLSLLPGEPPAAAAAAPIPAPAPAAAAEEPGCAAAAAADVLLLHAASGPLRFFFSARFRFLRCAFVSWLSSPTYSAPTGSEPLAAEFWLTKLAELPCVTSGWLCILGTWCSPPPC